MNELNKAIADIERPARIKKLLISEQGFPVPWFVATINGVPDFRAIAPGAIAAAYNRRLCWICGEPLGRFLAFVIGPMCAINRVSSEPPSHKECADYAAKACPFLSKPRMRRNETNADHLPKVSEGPGIAIMHNPGVALVWITHDYKPISDGKGGVLFEIGSPINASFYCEGRPATHDEVMAAIGKGFPILQDVARSEGREAVAELELRYRKAMELVP